MEAKKPVIAANDVVLSIPFFKDLVIILGFLAIIINLLMCIVYLITVLFRKISILPKWIGPVNFIFLFIQFYYFFF